MLEDSCGGGSANVRGGGAVIPVMQTEFGRGKGNCFAACIASVMELDLLMVPNFCCQGESDWVTACNSWLNQYGLSLFTVVFKTGTFVPIDVYYLMAGPSVRGLLHSVVAFDGKMVHDPHPDGTGIEEIQEIDLFIINDPAVARGFAEEMR